jgi:hypothetical protein
MSTSALLNLQIIENNTQVKFIDTLPQANDFNQVINIIQLLKNKKYSSHAELHNLVDYHERTLDYYLNAALNFNLIGAQKRGNCNYYYISDEHQKKLEQDNKIQMIFYVRKLMKNDVIKLIVNNFLDKGEYLTNQEVTDYVINKHPEIGLSDYTLNRRIDCIISWSKWTVEHIKYVF